MPFSRPTRTEQIDRIRRDLATRLQLGETVPRRSTLGVLAHVEGEAMFTLYGFIAWQALQILPDTAAAEYLERHADIWGIARTAAVAATGTVAFTGTDGTVIPAGTVLTRDDDVQFTTDAEATIAAGAASADVTASAAGTEGNSDEDEVLTLVAPIAGVTATATVAAGGLSGGAADESDGSLLARLLARIQQPPQGGADFDYAAWALETVGVTIARRGTVGEDGATARPPAVWVYPGELGLGTVTVRLMVDDGAGGMRVPTAPEVALVQAQIDLRRPVTADVTVAAPVAVPLDLTIALTPDTAAARAAVQAELADLILREAEPGGTILISHIREAISVAAGETDHVLTVPAANVTHTTGQIAALGTITWA